MDTSNKKLKLFLYARKSQESEDRQVQSIEDQIRFLKPLEARYNFEIYEILEESKSAKTPYTRPVFEELIKRIEKGEADGIICWELNRLSRNPVDSGKIQYLLQEGVIKVIQTYDKQYLPKDNALLFSIESAMANQYIRDLRVNVIRGMEGRAERGWLPLQPMPGYKNDKNEGTIVKDEERFPLIRKMWDLMLTGAYTPSQICDIANNEWGYRTRAYKRIGGVKLPRSQIYFIFNSIFYTGVFEFRGKIYQGKHEPMITTEEYDIVQLLLGHKGKPRSQKHEFSFTGTMRCGECMSMITATEKRKFLKETGTIGKYVYYHCTKKNPVIRCTQRPIKLSDLESQITALLESFTIPQRLFEWSTTFITNAISEKENKREVIFKNLQSAKAKIERQINNLIRMRYMELIEEKTFIEQKTSLDDELEKIEVKIKTFNSFNTSDTQKICDDTLHFMRFAKESFQTATNRRKRMIFTSLGSNFALKDKKLLINNDETVITLQKMFEMLMSEFNRLELTKQLNFHRQNRLTEGFIPTWCARLDDVRTIMKNISFRTVDDNPLNL